MCSSSPTSSSDTQADSPPARDALSRPLAWLLIGFWILLVGISSATALNRNWAKPINRNSVEAVAYWRTLGGKYLLEGNDNAARVAYETAVRIWPSDADAQADLGGIYQKLGDFDRAVEVLERALELGPGDPAQVYTNLADVYGRQRDLPRALQYFDKAAEVAIEPAEALTAIAAIQLEQGKRKEAIATFRKALASWEDPVGQYRESLLRFRAANAKYPDLVKLVDESLKRPVTEEALRAYDLESLKAQRVASALSGKARYFLGKALVAEGETKEGIRLLREAQDSLPTAPLISKALRQAEAAERRAANVPIIAIEKQLPERSENPLP